eukprot:432977_1
MNKNVDDLYEILRHLRENGITQQYQDIKLQQEIECKMHVLQEQMQITKREIDSLTTRISNELNETALPTYRHKLVNMLLEAHKTALEEYDEESKLYRQYQLMTPNFNLIDRIELARDIHISRDVIESENNSCEPDTNISTMYDCRSIESCNHLKSLLNLMNTAKNIEDLDDVNISEILNDYLHLMTTHDDDIQFEEIVNKFKYCDIKNCKVFQRNNRNRNDEKQNQKHINTCTAIMQILDKIHCYFCHCYDTGCRLSCKEKKMVNDDIDENKNVSFTQKLVDEKTLKINKILFKKRQIYNDLNISERMNKKFNQLFQANLISDEKNQQQDDNKIYSFGYKFKYDKESDPLLQQLSRLLSDIDEKYENGIYVTAKYLNLKEEITTNSLSVLSIDQYNSEYNKAKIHFNSQYNKNNCKNDEGNCLPLEYILSLMIYCNYDQLQYYFSKTYREENGNNHNNFYFLAKYVKISVHKFGTDDYAREKNFYHGINEQLVFTAYIYNSNDTHHTSESTQGVIINGPLSTSTSFEVATNFTNFNQGLVIKFGNESNNFFSVSWLSDFPNEH